MPAEEEGAELTGGKLRRVRRPPGTFPLLANEIFGALDQMYSPAVLPLAQGAAGARDLREILLSAIRVPSQYAGPRWSATFHRRLAKQWEPTPPSSSTTSPDE